MISRVWSSWDRVGFGRRWYHSDSFLEIECNEIFMTPTFSTVVSRFGSDSEVTM